MNVFGMLRKNNNNNNLHAKMWFSDLTVQLNLLFSKGRCFYLVPLYDGVETGVSSLVKTPLKVKGTKNVISIILPHPNIN